jgi:CBS domain containing-hemolysin-like protein
VSSGIGLWVGLAMLLGNAFFVGAEFGLVSARRSNIELEAQKGSRAARITLGAMEQISLMLAGAQLGVTLCSLVLGALAEPALAGLLEPLLHMAHVPAALLHPISLAISLVIVVYLHVVIGEMVPKNMALASPTAVALRLTPPLVLFVRLTRPLVASLNYVAVKIIQLVGVTPRDEIASGFDRDEVAGFVKESRREGLLSYDEATLLSGALNFEQSKVSRVIIPIDKLVVAPHNASAADIERLCQQTGYSRFPIVGKSGELSGYVHLRDVIGVSESRYHQPLTRSLIRPLASFTDQSTIRRVLVSMQKQGSHLAQVTDRKGAVVGLVALEDILEELVGTIRDGTQVAESL